MTFKITEKMTEEEIGIFNKYKDQFPFDVVVFANDLGLELFLDDELEDTISGFITYEKDKYSIVINDNFSEVRNRFTIAHGLGHYFYDKEYLTSNGTIVEEKLDAVKNNKDPTLVGNRKYIMVQLDEETNIESEFKTIFDVCKKRMIRVRNKLKEENTDLYNLDTDFKVFHFEENTSNHFKYVNTD